MPVISPAQAGGLNRCAFLDALASSEIGEALLAVTDNGYNVLVGATPSNPITFSSYAKHPGILNAALNSTAAGRYQLLFRWWSAYSVLLRLPDFSPLSQDLIALQQIRERRALPLIDSGQFSQAIAACSNLWASLPGAGYGQHTNSLDSLKAAYILNGGTVA